MTLILDGKKLSETIATRLKQDISTYTSKPTLVIIQIGNIPASNIYIQRKKVFAEKIGANVILKQYPLSTTEQEIITDIDAYNHNPLIHGIIVQLPIPAHLHKDLIIHAISPHKDVDGLTSTNIKHLYSNDSKGVTPATTRGILTLLEAYNIEVTGKNIVIIGRSLLVGKPTALACMNKNATVTVCHKHTVHIEEETRRADILIVAMGVPGYITKKHVSPHQTVIDVGINALDNEDDTSTKRKISGDVEYEIVSTIVEAITPVPGGIGPMTVVSLFENLFEQFIKTV